MAASHWYSVSTLLLRPAGFAPCHTAPSSVVLPHPQWDVAKAAVKSYDLQGKTVGSLGGGAIATHVMKRLKVSKAT